MKLFNKIKAFFKYKGENAEVDASAVEIRNGYVYLHSVEDPKQIRRIRSHAVEIFINPNENISEDDLDFFETKEKNPAQEQHPPDEGRLHTSSPNTVPEIDRKAHTRNRYNVGTVEWGYF